jgi:adenine deaminase
MHFAAEIVTQSQIRDLSTSGGAVHADPSTDLLKAVALDRYGVGRIGRGLVSGFGRLRGAVAASVSFDTNNLVALGGSDADMLLALERTLALGGGVVVAADGAIRAEIPLPLGGITSEQPMTALGAEIIRIQKALHELGCTRENPLLSVQVLTFTAIPALRIRERGLWDVRSNRVVPLILDEGEA